MRSIVFRSTIISCITLLTISACATKPEDIEAAYVSPLTYEAYNCEQIAGEAERVSLRAAEVTGAQKKKAKNDAGAMAVGLILFWPALLFIKGDSATEVEVARLKGEMAAIEKVSHQKECGLVFQSGESA